MAIVVWWWRARPRLLAVRTFSLEEIERSLARERAIKTANWKMIGHGELVHVLDLPGEGRAAANEPGSEPRTRRWLRRKGRNFETLETVAEAAQRVTAKEQVAHPVPPKVVDASEASQPVLSSDRVSGEESLRSS